MTSPVIDQLVPPSGHLDHGRHLEEVGRRLAGRAGHVACGRAARGGQDAAAGAGARHRPCAPRGQEVFPLQLFQRAHGHDAAQGATAQDLPPQGRGDLQPQEALESAAHHGAHRPTRRPLGALRRPAADAAHRRAVHGHVLPLVRSDSPAATRHTARSECRRARDGRWRGRSRRLGHGLLASRSHPRADASEHGRRVVLAPPAARRGRWSSPALRRPGRHARARHPVLDDVLVRHRELQARARAVAADRERQPQARDGGARGRRRGRHARDRRDAPVRRRQDPRAGVHVLDVVDAPQGRPAAVFRADAAAHLAARGRARRDGRALAARGQGRAGLRHHDLVVRGRQDCAQARARIDAR